MHIKTIAVEYRRKFNLGNYESLELSQSMWATVDEDEPHEGVEQFLWMQCKQGVRREIQALRESMNRDET